MFLTLLFPGNIEYIISYFTNNGNMALTGIFLGLYYKRNLFYFTIIISPFSFIYNYMIYNLFFTLLSLFLFYNYYCEWKGAIKMHFDK
jgi:hypothetical protein